MLVGFAIIGYGLYKFVQFLIPSLRPKNKQIQAFNPWIEAHRTDDKNRQDYESYLKWAEENDKPVLFSFESFQEKVQKKQNKKIVRLFR